MGTDSPNEIVDTIKELKCPYCKCNKSFKTRNGLNKHNRKKHGIKRVIGITTLEHQEGFGKRQDEKLQGKGEKKKNKVKLFIVVKLRLLNFS